MRFRPLLTALCLIAAAGCQDGPAAGPAATGDLRPTPERPNIIFILADDQAPNTTGFEGNTLIRTPHLDRMAAEGTWFSRAYNVLPQCAPSRATLLTGYYPHQYGPLHNDDAQLDPQVDTVAQILKAEGYRTGMVGKWHLGNPLEKQAGFEDYWVGYDRLTTPRKEKYTHPTIVVNGRSQRVERYLTDVFTDYAIEFLDQQPDQRAFLWLAFHAPHEPVTPHPDHPYDPEDMVLPENMRDNMRDKPNAQRVSAPARAFQAMTPGQLKRHKADYYSMISAIDANVGRLLEHLRTTGRDRNTLVVYMSDNGWLIGEHKMFTKGGSFYEELVRTPLVFWQPETVPAGVHSPALVSSLDLQPTLCRRGGSSYPAGRKGYDLWPLVLGEVASVRSEAMMEYMQKSSAHPTPAVAIVDERYKITFYGGSEVSEFYDLQTDPLEMNNLYGKPGMAQVIDPYRRRVIEFFRLSGM